MIAWEVSTLPATTAAGYTGASIEPSGITSRSGRRQPSLSGMSVATSVRNTYSTAAVTTEDGALKFVASCGDVPVKSIVADRRSRSTVTRTAITAPESVS